MERKLQEEILKQLGKYVMIECILSIIIIEASKQESSNKRMLQEERSNFISKYYYIQ